MLKHQQFEFAILNLLIKLYITVILEIENVTFTLSFIQNAVYELVYISLQCDAIVNSTSDDLYLDQGAVSATILAAAGEDIQKECDKIIIRRGRKPLSPMEVEMTKGYNLGCKYVLHGALISPWNEQV
jgi:hypothetical protein